MNLREIAQGAPYHLATSIQECPFDRFWVVQLDCGIEVYQSEENSSYDEPNPWMRLKKFCLDYTCKPLNMARANRDLNPQNQINLDPLADGYFYSRRVRRLLCNHPDLSGYQDRAQGIGQLHGNILKIVWEFDNRHGFEFEERNLEDNFKSGNEFIIRK